MTTTPTPGAEMPGALQELSALADRIEEARGHAISIDPSASGYLRAAVSAAAQPVSDVLRAHAEGRTSHINQGHCPDAVSGHDSRDPACPVCQALSAAAPAAPAEGIHNNAEEVKPMFWVRLCSDGGYEGPLHDDRIEHVRKLSGAWYPLYLGAAPQAQQPGAAYGDAMEAANFRWLRDRNDWYAEPRLDELDGTVWKLTFYTPARIEDPSDDTSLDAAVTAARIADYSGARAPGSTAWSQQSGVSRAARAGAQAAPLAQTPDASSLGSEYAEWIGGAKNGRIETSVERLGGAIAAAIDRYAARAGAQGQQQEDGCR